MEKTGANRLNKRIKVLLIAAAVFVAIVCLIVIITQAVGSFKPENNSILVYSRNGEKVIRIGKYETVLTNSDASDFKCDAASGRVFYTVDSGYSDGLYDLYFVELRRSEMTEPKMIDYAIEKNYEVSSGKIYYLKENKAAGANDGCVCDIDNWKIETFSNNVKSLFPLEGTDTVYFIKMHGSAQVLYKYYEASPVEVCRNISEIHGFGSAENPHIIYEKNSEVYVGMTELYIARAEGNPELICDNTFDVKYDSYSPGGNLYYFTSSSESISWSYVIADPNAESDKAITRPKRDNFFAIFGISTEYNQALSEYQDKLVRDEIRAALNETMEKGEFTAPVFSAFAYRESGSCKVAENINPKNVYSVAVFGDPKIIYEATEVLPSSTDMEALVSIAQRSTMTEVIEYARNIVDSSIASQGLAMAAYGSEGAVSYALEGYDKEKTVFSFPYSGSRVFAFVRDLQGERLTLYSNSLDEKLKPSSAVNVDTGISSYRFINDSVIYLKTDVGKNTGDIYSYDGVTNVKLSNAAEAFTLSNSEKVIILKNHNERASKATADYYFYNGSSEEIIDSEIDVESFNYAENDKAAYISSVDKSCCLNIYYDGKSAVISQDVSEILLFE